MLLVTTALSGLMAGMIQTAPAPAQPPQQVPVAQQPAEEPAVPTATAEEAEDAVDLGVVNATGQRPRGSVDSDIPPDLSLNAEQLQAYGASTIEELLTYLEPATRSSRGSGPPITLVNGRRISGFQEIQGIPPEAIERVDILPEEVAVEYGYRPEQRVVNFVLKSNFRSITGQLEGRTPTDGGRTNTEINGNVLRISGAGRWSADAEYERFTPLFESERNLRRDPGNEPFDLIGNVTGIPSVSEIDPNDPFRGEVDPALSGLVGQTVIVAPVPVGTGPFTLNDFAAAYGPTRTGDLGAYRTLLSASERATARGTFKTDIDGKTQATISGSIEDVSTQSFNGLPGVQLQLPDANSFSPFANPVQVFRYLDSADSLARRNDTLTGKVGVLFDGYLGEDWRWTLAGNYDRVETDTVTGRGYSAIPFQARLAAGDPTANPFAALSPDDFTRIAPDTANSVSQYLSTELVLNGDVWDLPAGAVSSTFKLGADTRTLDSTSTRADRITGDIVTLDRSQSRDRYSGQASFNIPIASTRAEVLPALGDLSFNVNAGFEDLSDFGGLGSLGVGVNWTPWEPVSFLVSYTDEQAAPTIGQLNDPIISTPNVPVFDFSTGETVLVTQITGGNPDLDAEDRKVWRAGVTLNPIKDTDFRIQSTWTRTTIEDSINAFPAITPALEAALPGRFVRGPGGELLSVDARALNFASAERQDLRTGFNFSKAFGRPNPAAANAAGGPGGGPRPGGAPMVVRMEGGGGDGPRAGGPGGGGGGPQFRMGGGGGRGGGMQPGQGRFNVSLYHTYRIQDEILIADGIPPLDLLDGDATSSRGGSPRNEIQAQAGVFKNGMGAFMNANWRESTRIDGGDGPDLRFSDLTTVNLNLFIDLGQQAKWVEKYPWLKGSRLNLGIQNLFEQRIQVTSSDGETPLNYQPDYLDPQGRTIGLTFRKILF